MTFTYQHDFRTFTAEIHRIGPAIQVVAYEGEFYAFLAIGYMQSGDSTAVISKSLFQKPYAVVRLRGRLYRNRSRYFAPVSRRSIN